MLVEKEKETDPTPRTPFWDGSLMPLPFISLSCSKAHVVPTYLPCLSSTSVWPSSCMENPHRSPSPSPTIKDISHPFYILQILVMNPCFPENADSPIAVS
jgi:hypothetical protein